MLLTTLELSDKIEVGGAQHSAITEYYTNFNTL